jgi:hypothetical protein
MPAPDLTPYVELALACVHREYPSQLALAMKCDDDARPPRELTPAFYGCYDWHSAVHGHWLLARALRVAPAATFGGGAHEALARSLTADHVARELAFLGPRPTFERPYGLAWLLLLHAELATSDDATLRMHGATLAPLAELAAGRFREWLPKLTHPIRSGVHSQTAFAMGFVLDWARAVGEDDTRLVVEARAIDFHADDHGYATHLEPSGEDFLSPSLGAADLMARILEPRAFATWLERAMPALGRPAADATPLHSPVAASDREDGRLAHLDGLNASRAWMLARIARALPETDARVEPLRVSARAHEERALSAIEGAPYAGAHWLGTFATMLLTS